MVNRTVAVTLSFANGVVLITGGSRGIGAACVRLFAEAGARVAFSYRQARSQAEALVRECGPHNCFAIASELIRARARAGLSQAELAARMGTSQSAIARLESGRGMPSTRTLGRFAKATGHRLKISFEPVQKRG